MPSTRSFVASAALCGVLALAGVNSAFAHNHGNSGHGNPGNGASGGSPCGAPAGLSTAPGRPNPPGIQTAPGLNNHSCPGVGAPIVPVSPPSVLIANDPMPKNGSDSMGEKYPMKENALGAMAAMSANRSSVALAGLGAPGSGGGGSAVAAFGLSGSDLAKSLGRRTVSAMSLSEAEGYVVSVWATSSYTDFNAELANLGSEGSLTTAQIGMDVTVGDQVLIGVMALGDFFDAESGYMKPALGRVIKSSGDGFLAGPYLVLDIANGVRIDAIAAAGHVWNEYEVSDKRAEEYGSNRLLLSAGAGADWSFGDLSINPKARVSYYVEQRETFTDSANNVFDESTQSLGQLRLGSEIGYDLTIGDASMVRPFVGAEGVWAFRQSKIAVSQQVTAPEELSASFSAGFDAMLGPVMMRLSGRYDGVGANNFEAVTGELQLRAPLN